MGKIQELLREYKTLEEKKVEILNQMNQEILNLPDNPNITRLGAGNSYSMSISEIMKDKTQNMSAEHYDFKFQYRCIVQSLQTARDFIAKLNDIISTGKVLDYRGSTHMVKLHETVISYLKEIKEAI